ncbi:hypothetical protein Ancab_033191, partial [Ancistrocladus abbreviatus]
MVYYQHVKTDPFFASEVKKILPLSYKKMPHFCHKSPLRTSNTTVPAARLQHVYSTIAFFLSTKKAGPSVHRPSHSYLPPGFTRTISSSTCFNTCSSSASRTLDLKTRSN